MCKLHLGRQIRGSRPLRREKELCPRRFCKCRLRLSLCCKIELGQHPSYCPWADCDQPRRIDMKPAVPTRYTKISSCLDRNNDPIPAFDLFQMHTFSRSPYNVRPTAETSSMCRQSMQTKWTAPSRETRAAAPSVSARKERNSASLISPEAIANSRSRDVAYWPLQ